MFEISCLYRVRQSHYDVTKSFTGGAVSARAPSEHGSAPSHRQKHPLEIKENTRKTPCTTNTDIQQKLSHLTLNLSKSRKRTATISPATL